MIYKTVNTIALIAIAGFIVVVLFATKMSFQTVNRHIDSAQEDVAVINSNQKDIVSNLLEFTEVVEEMSNHIYINKVEIERLKNELGYPNDLDEQAEELFNILAEENAE